MLGRFVTMNEAPKIHMGGNTVQCVVSKTKEEENEKKTQQKPVLNKIMGSVLGESCTPKPKLEGEGEGLEV